VKFVLNKRWLIRRGANIDVESLLRNVPGGVTMVNNVETDALPVNWQDVTSSSYQEQDRVNVDFDELAGNFAQSSVMTNRKLNETVGGMRMMSQGANMMTEYDIRVFVETWVEPVLRQLVKLEEAYETDQVVLGVAGQKSGYFQKFGQRRADGRAARPGTDADGERRHGRDRPGHAPAARHAGVLMYGQARDGRGRRTRTCRRSAR
jgi:hypothetical protein